jgi:hypothetical protein
MYLKNALSLMGTGANNLPVVTASGQVIEIVLTRASIRKRREDVRNNPRGRARREDRVAGKVDMPEGARLLVTVLPEEDKEFWLGASQSSLGKVWDNAEDDVYGKLLGG